MSSREYYQSRVLSHESDASRHYYACLTDDANQMFVFLLPQDVRTIFLESSAKIWVDQRMRTESGQQSSSCTSLISYAWWNTFHWADPVSIVRPGVLVLDKD